MGQEDRTRSGSREGTNEAASLSPSDRSNYFFALARCRRFFNVAPGVAFLAAFLSFGLIPLYSKRETTSCASSIPNPCRCRSPISHRSRAMWATGILRVLAKPSVTFASLPCAMSTSAFPKHVLSVVERGLPPHSILPMLPKHSLTSAEVPSVNISSSDGAASQLWVALNVSTTIGDAEFFFIFGTVVSLRASARC